MYPCVRPFLSLRHCPPLFTTHSPLYVRCLVSESHDQNFLLLALALSSLLVSLPGTYSLSAKHPPWARSNRTVKTYFLVGLSYLLGVLVRLRPCVDCRHVIVCLSCECPRMNASERALNCLIKIQRYISSLISSSSSSRYYKANLENVLEILMFCYFDRSFNSELIGIWIIPVWQKTNYDFGAFLDFEKCPPLILCNLCTPTTTMINNRQNCYYRFSIFISVISAHAKYYTFQSPHSNVIQFQTFLK